MANTNKREREREKERDIFLCGAKLRVVNSCYGWVPLAWSKCTKFEHVGTYMYTMYPKHPLVILEM